MPPAEAQTAVVLVAEDNKTAQTMIRSVLTRLGCTVEIVNDGAEALAALEGVKQRYGILLTDCNMPKMDGFELARTWRAREAQQGSGHLPIIALTADALPQTEQQCLDAGMDGMLSKPVKREVLATLLQKWNPGALRAAEATVAAAAPTPPSAATSVAPIDHAVIEAQLQTADRQAHIEALQSFLEFCGNGPTELQAALDESSTAKTRQVAHSLKGAAAMVGATALSGRLAAIEQAGRNGDLAAAAAAMGDLRNDFEEIRRYLAGLMAAR